MNIPQQVLAACPDSTVPLLLGNASHLAFNFFLLYNDEKHQAEKEGERGKTVHEGRQVTRKQHSFSKLMRNSSD